MLRAYRKEPKVTAVELPELLTAAMSSDAVVTEQFRETTGASADVAKFFIERWAERWARACVREHGRGVVLAPGTANDLKVIS